MKNNQKSINVFFDFVDGPWGGGNQFLKALRGEYGRRGIYENDFRAADIILANSRHKLKEIIKLKIKYSDK